MADLTANFKADFSSFVTAVQNAEVKLKTFQDGAGKAGDAVNRMANSLSGTSLIQQATAMSEAVKRLGGEGGIATGLLTLTDKELERVAATAKEAAAKFVALGQDVPPGIQKIADSVKTTGSTVDSFKSILGGVAGAFGVAFSVGAVVNFGKQVVETAGHINDLASQLGISTDAVQGFKYAAEQSGSSLDTVGTSINKMNVNLAGGDKATVQALKDAGLQFNAIRSLKPEDAFLAIADAIQGIPDPMKQADVAMQVFGKSGAELLPAIKAGFRDVSDAASKMSADTIQTLDDAGDAWDRLETKVTNVSGSILSHTIHTVEGATDSWKSFGMFVDNALKFGVGAAAAMANVQDRATEASKKNRDINLSLAPAVHKTAEELAAAAAAAKRHAEALESLFSKFSGSTATAQLRDLDTVFRRMAASGQITEKQIDAIVKEALKLQSEGGKLTQRLLDMVTVTGALSPGLITTAINFKEMGDQVAIVEPKVSDLWRDLAKPPVEGIANLRFELSNLIAVTPETMLKGVLTKTHDVDKALGELSRSFAELAQIAGGSLGEMVRQFGTIISAIETTNKSLKSIKEGTSALKAGEALAGITSMATGILGIASAAIAAGKAIANLFDRNKGRDLVVDFAETFGGFDQLHAELLELGDEGERLWIALTQGVGRNNPKEAQKAIDEVTAALAKKTDASSDAVIATEEEAQATIETAAAAAKALDQVSERLDVNREEWSEWSEDVTGYLQKLADTIRSMPVPSPTGPSYPGGASFTGGSATYTPPRSDNTGYRGNGPTTVQFVTPSMQVLAEGVIPEMPAARKRLGVG